MQEKTGGGGNLKATQKMKGGGRKGRQGVFIVAGVLTKGDYVEKPYRLLYPMKTVLITSKGEKENVMAASWCFPLSNQPPMFGVSVTEKRYSYETIREGKAFGINLADKGMESMVVGAGRSSGREMDKFAEFGIEKEYGELGIPLVKQSPASIECRLVQEIKTGDHVLFVGEAVNVVKRREAKCLYQKAGLEFIEI
jgi:flavin reductase (DIM6/NTAB) family NADH-FMN oxidoreductase RutF